MLGMIFNPILDGIAKPATTTRPSRPPGTRRLAPTLNNSGTARMYRHTSIATDLPSGNEMISNCDDPNSGCH